MQFDESFLQEMGLSAMPEDQKQAFLDYIQKWHKAYLLLLHILYQMEVLPIFQFFLCLNRMF